MSYVAHVDPVNGLTVFELGSDTTYGGPGGTDPRTTLYSYTFVPNSNQIASEIITSPPIDAAQNGPASSNTDTTDADVTIEFFDGLGNVQWTRVGTSTSGFIDYDQYDPLTGALLKQIVDVNTADTGDFSGLPSGWSSPLTSLELITTYGIDSFGRVISETDPNGNMTDTTYLDGPANGGTDVNNGVSYFNGSGDPTGDAGGFYGETITYPGWHSVSGQYTSTGPVQITREDRSSTIVSATSTGGTTNTLVDSRSGDLSSSASYVGAIRN